jgi:3-methyladenine DNA glycosylase AlkD
LRCFGSYSRIVGTIDGITRIYQERNGKMMATQTSRLVRPGGHQRMAELQALESEIRAYCAAHADPQIVAKYSRYFTEGYNAFGLSDSVINPKRNDWFNEYREELGLEGFLDLGDILWQSRKYEEGLLAIHFVSRFKQDFHPPTLDRLGRWFEVGVSNWAHCDVLCGTLLGEFLTRKIVPLQALEGWRESPFKYQRRAVPVTLLALLKPEAEYTPILDFIRPLMLDKERVVQQGVGWFLRQAWKGQPKLVETFLFEWKDSSPRLIFQYATEKMTPQNKAHFATAK